MALLKRWISRTLDRLAVRASRVRLRQPLLFVHIPKTAGTSMRQMLEDEFGPRLVYPGTHYLRQLPVWNYPLGSDMLRNFGNLPPHAVLTGHFTAAMADLLPRPYATATFVREPGQRSLSMLGHLSRRRNVEVHALLDDPLFVARNIADFQTRLLGADGVCDPDEVGAADGAMLDRALKRLEVLDFVGLTERFAESCTVFDARFGTGVSRSIRRENVQRPDGHELAEYVPRILPFIERDRMLYEHAVARFDAMTG